ncbi:Uncharacterized protein APZ42_027692 [Daphnia magna]|uniref:Uncharacterized protein n=1 Tax=Daphnia magna TaxID=35525 RepID=A0A164R7J1_9CRUS|nr:Uncharacterized protein APZ42_027692 [Daphnia magna]
MASVDSGVASSNSEEHSEKINVEEDAAAGTSSANANRCKKASAGKQSAAESGNKLFFKIDRDRDRLDQFDQKRIVIDFDHFDQKFGGIEIDIIDRHLVIDAQHCKLHHVFHTRHPRLQTYQYDPNPFLALTSITRARHPTPRQTQQVPTSRLLPTDNGFGHSPSKSQPTEKKTMQYHNPATPSDDVKLTDGKPNFKSMPIAERKRMQDEIIAIMGEPRDSTVLMGGDLAIHTINSNQGSNSERPFLLDFELT